MVLRADVNKVITKSGYVESISTGGNDLVKIGGGGAGSIATNDGHDKVVTTTKWVRDIYTGNGRDEVVIGKGNAGRVDTGVANDKVIAKGWVEMIQTDLGKDVVLIRDGGAGLIRTGGGNDKITTNAGHVLAIRAAEGHDVVKIGVGGASTVFLGNGNDKALVSELSDITQGVVVHGRSGTDTIDFGNFTVGVTFSLDMAGQYQNVGDPNGDVSAAPAKGYFAETSVENILGSGLDDNLQGDSEANLLSGRKGADTLEGMEGADIIFVGNDAVVDTLIYNSVDDSTAAERDTVKLFVVGTDKIDLSGIDGDSNTEANDALVYSASPNVANSVWVEVSGADEIVKGDVTGDGVADFEILLENVTGLSASDFILS